ncbi:MAG: DUF5050 domain-containing protein [Clostridia bacterium]|nr:DUF5050 domain-containing protein [Clostridia bacterium]
MKKIFLFSIILVALMLYSCVSDDNIPQNEVVSVPDITPEIVQDEKEEVHYEIVDNPPVPEENKSDNKQVEYYVNSNGNLINNASALLCGDYIYYDTFVVDPTDEFMGGHHRICKIKSDFTGETETVFEPYFATIDMFMYDNKLYYSSGSGGGRHLLEFDTQTGNEILLHDNLPEDTNIFVNSIYFAHGFMIYECNGKIYRMKPDQTEFEVLLDAPEDWGVSLVGAEGENIFYYKYSDHTVHCMSSLGDNVIISDYSDDLNYINIYDRRVYYYDSPENRIVSCDFDGLETRTVIQFEEHQTCRRINVTDGYIYYAMLVSPASENDPAETISLYEYNLNGGETRLIISEGSIYGMSVINRKIYFFENYYDAPVFCLIDVESLEKSVLK